MKKICYVVTIPLTVKAFFIPQIKYLSDNGFDVTVVCSPDETLPRLLGNSVHLHFLDMPRGFSFMGSLKVIKSLYSFFKAEKFDLIQYSTPNASLYAAVSSFLAGCEKRNYHLMGFRYLGSRGIVKGILKAIEKITCLLSTSIECVSKTNLEFGINQKLFPRHKVTVVWNGSTGGVDLKRFDITQREKWRNDLRDKLGYNGSDVVFGFVGRITADKGINELLESFFRLRDESKLFIIGSNENDGSINSMLWEKAKKSPNVKIYEASDNIEQFYAMIDVLVLPSYREGFGNVIIEAAAMGTPAIVSNIPGPIDCMIEGKTALSVMPGSVDDLVEKMHWILELDYPEMGKNAREYVAKSFDSEELCDRILARKKNLVGCETGL